MGGRQKIFRPDSRFPFRCYKVYYIYLPLHYVAWFTSIEIAIDQTMHVSYLAIFPIELAGCLFFLLFCQQTYCFFSEICLAGLNCLIDRPTVDINIRLGTGYIFILFLFLVSIASIALKVFSHSAVSYSEMQESL